MKEEVQRVHLSLSPDLLKRVDEEREKTGDNRSNFIRRALIQYLESLEMLKHMPEFMNVAKQALERQKELESK